MKNSLKALVHFASTKQTQSKVVGDLLKPEQVELITGAQQQECSTHTQTCTDCNHAQSCKPPA